MKPFDLSEITDALDLESYEYLTSSFPVLVERVERAIANGHTPDDIRRAVLRHNGPERHPLAIRVYQAACHAQRTQRS